MSWIFFLIRKEFPLWKYGNLVINHISLLSDHLSDKLPVAWGQKWLFFILCGLMLIHRFRHFTILLFRTETLITAQASALIEKIKTIISVKLQHHLKVISLFHNLKYLYIIKQINLHVETHTHTQWHIAALWVIPSLLVPYFSPDVLFSN